MVKFTSPVANHCCRVYFRLYLQHLERDWICNRMDIVLAIHSTHARTMIMREPMQKTSASGDNAHGDAGTHLDCLVWYAHRGSHTLSLAVL